MSDGEIVDVALVGYGPVGALLASALGRRGVRVAVFERDAEIFALPRAVHLDAEAIRVIQSVGLIDAVLPCTAPTRGMEFVSSRGERYFGTTPRGVVPAPTRHGWHPGYMFYQPDLERALRSGAERHPSVTVELGQRVEAIAQTAGADCARLEVRDLDRASRRSVRARYAVGCDGAHSTTRRAIGARLESLGYDRQWLVVDTFLRREVALPSMSQQICDPARPTTFVCSAGRHRRFEFQLRPGESALEMERPEQVARLLSRWLAPEDADVARAKVYEFHGVVASPWRSGRLLLAGDAAHQMPPFQGQGLCGGIRDVANLAWKLAWVLDGRAGDAVLDSYEAERAPHVRAMVASSIRVGQLIEALAAAEARGEGFEDASLEANATRRMGWMPRLCSGLMPPVSADDPGPVGNLLVQPRVRLRGGPVQRLDDVLGGELALLTREDPGRLLGAAARAFLERVGARLLGSRDLEDLDGWLGEALGRHAALIVRPDGYVLGAADDGPALDAQLERLRDALGQGARPD